MVAGWQFGFGSAEAVFSETEVAMENAKEGSWSGSETSCVDIPDSSFGGLGYARICVKQGETYCEWDFYNKFGPSGTGTCYF